ncbi:cysteine-rich DPF motif domain-containing protein 1-like isoform X1 [Mizuhopecten yessoensis]|uniref:cysteine-rich DPF motif domain-containing protein 1-like isoform X1 n=1 Tax=Mizuhopecten yessoensis TaxID=6573 RepID=UPI000B45EC42|nr:cysteine-rich DPF motif domain-containing protein 1-like isoform X1 [Mizuhopecten yessoensis]
MAGVSIDDEEKVKTFICKQCDFSSNFQYFGSKPPFLKSILLLEEAYIKKDPFSSDCGIITLGSHCHHCKLSVCCSTSCSIFYTKRFCLDCVEKNINELPMEIRQEILRKHQTD